MASLTLTPQQQAVVENRGGSLLVSAAAGSGKTKVLVERLFRYVTQERCNVDDFLIITYTKAAAAELRGKIAAELSKRLGEDPGDAHLRRQLLRVYQADIKTVDAFCTALLRENTHLLAREGERHALTPDFRVLDESEADLLRRRVLERTLETFYETLDPGKEQLADTLGAGRDDSALAELVLEVYEKLQSHADPEAWLEHSAESWSALNGSFDDTPYAAALLETVRRRARHWAALLADAAERVAEDEALSAGYGEKFLTAAGGFASLGESSTWERPGSAVKR
ncbi:MAG: UvrD-helicase domain-containing protein [Dysosmobacter sp.]